MNNNEKYLVDKMLHRAFDQARKKAAIFNIEIRLDDFSMYQQQVAGDIDNDSSYINSCFSSLIQCACPDSVIDVFFKGEQRTLVISVAIHTILNSETLIPLISNCLNLNKPVNFTVQCLSDNERRLSVHLVIPLADYSESPLD